MRKKWLKGFAPYAKNNRRRRAWQKFVRVLCCIVVFCTTYALILPAITMEADTQCELTEHTHDGSCYQKITAREITVLDCSYETLSVHTHTQDCGEEGARICGFADYIVHKHNDLCLGEDGVLVCSLPEIEAHTHTEECWQTVEPELPPPEEEITDPEVPDAEITDEETTDTEITDPETTDPEITDTEVTDPEITDPEITDTEITDMEITDPEITDTETTDVETTDTEVIVEEPSDEVVTTSESAEAEPPGMTASDSGSAEKILICQKEEIILHEHTENCYEDSVLICTFPALSEHSHNDTCFTVRQIPMEDTQLLTCGQDESDTHSHSERCYGTWELTCGMQEHSHASHDLTITDSIIAFPSTTSSSVSTEGGSISMFVQNENYYSPNEIILIDGYRLTEYCDPNYYGGNPLPFGDYSQDGRSYAMNADALASFRTGNLSFTDYTAIVVEYLNRPALGDGESRPAFYPEYFVDAVVRGDAQLDPNTTILDLSPKTGYGFVLYIPNSLLTSQSTPSRGDLVSPNFWHGQEEVWQEGVGWVGAGPRLGWNSGLGTLTFTDNPAASAYLATTDGVSVNATIRMFDYTKSVNNTGNEYYFWNGDYGYGADTESTDGWGADFIWSNGEYVGANPYGSNANISLDAYHGYNRNPDVASTLSENGYPVLIDKNPSNLGNGLPLDYLFDGTYQTGSTMSGGGGLFQKDSSGYYYYDSLENAAYFNGRSFTLYRDLIVRPWADSNDSSQQAYGNFLPLNPINKNNITMDGYVYSNDRASVTGTTGWTGALTAYEQSQASASKTLEDTGNNRLTQAIFNKGKYTARLEEKANLWFGMNVEYEFYQPKDGKVGTAGNSEDMIFDFHGDDDVLVYVGLWDREKQDYDYRLVLDLSGVHEARSGTINFATGAVSYQKHSETASSGKEEVNTTLKAIFQDVTTLPSDTFQDYSRLALKFFFLERGGNVSYCRLRFNTPTLPEKSLMVTKTLTYDNRDADVQDYIADNHDFRFRVMKADENGDATDRVLITEGTSFSILENGTAVGTGKVGEDGIFTLKPGQSALFRDLLQVYGNCRYTVQELLPTELTGQYESTLYSISGGANTEANLDTGVSSAFTALSSTALSTAQSENINFTNRVDTEKLACLQITKALAEGASFPEGTTFPMLVELDGNPIPAGAVYTVDGSTYPVTTRGQIDLAVGKTAVISGILAGTDYSVREKDGDYTATYSGATSGTLKPGQTVQITVKNADYHTSVSIPIEKTYLGNSGSAAFHFAVDQVDSQGALLAQLDGTSITVSDDQPTQGDVFIKYSQSVADGTYYYRIYEKPGTLNASYDKHQYLVTIQVSGGVASVLSVDGNTYTGDPLAFVNQKLTSVAITKTVSGNISPKNLQFPFTATVLVNGEAYAPAASSVYTVNADGTVTFSLKADGTLYLRGIPVGAQVTVTEAAPEGFEPSFTVGEAVTEGNSVTITVAEDGNSILCNNESTYELPHTGGAGTNSYTLGGIILILISVAYLVYSKKRRRGGT